jgi:hypothetical protein
LNDRELKERDFAFENRMKSHVRHAIASALIRDADAIEDMKHNTDLIVFRLDKKRFGCRIRRNKYLYRLGYRWEFTIRSSRPSGAKTELAKILEGWGDYFFYGFSDRLETRLLLWTIGDLQIFRQAYPNVPKFECKNEEEGGSSFMIFQWDSFPGNFIKFRSEPIDIIDTTCPKCNHNMIAMSVYMCSCPRCAYTEDYRIVVERLCVNGMKRTWQRETDYLVDQDTNRGLSIEQLQQQTPVQLELERI